jgi:hypothetical protein
MVASYSGDVHDELREHGVEIRALKRRIESFSSGNNIRADAISGVIPATNSPVNWWYNGNLLGAGLKADLIEGSGVWISGTFVAGRAYYRIGAYAMPAPTSTSGVSFEANGSPLCFGAAIDLQQEWGIWISGSCVGGVATYDIGAYYQGGGGGASGTVHFYENAGLFCSALQVDLVDGYGVWISGTCVEAGSKAHYEIGVYPSAGGGDDMLALAYAVAF